MALSLCAQEVLWLRHVFEELGAKNQPPTVIKIDNKAAISMAEHSGYQSRAKHIDLRYHFVRDAVKNNDIELEYVPTASQLADYMTKVLHTPQYLKLVKSSGVHD
ncbi:hypothetical protein ATCC90586_009159 [Pythium insidiosum]|nr:hypothetical protein ATCC90586_009159 [Pythium insidiosum]